MRIFRGVFCPLVILAVTGVNGQSISSIYSDRGVGLLNYQGLPNNSAMGEVGVAVPSRLNLNFQNPAFLPFNNLTLFQVGLEMDRRSLTNGGQSMQEVSVGLRYLNFSFPIISDKWTSSFGITPFSTVNYKSFIIDSLDNNQTIVSTNFSGRGGLTSFKWANGFRISDDFFVGIRVSYLFGTIDKQARSILEDGNVANHIIDFKDEVSYSGTLLELSAGYQKVLSDGQALNFGAVYELSRDIKGKSDKIFEILNNSLQPISTRTVAESAPISFTLPSSIELGTSFQFNNKYSIGLDVKSTNWKKVGADEEAFINTKKIGIGGQWTPDYGSVKKYFRRITYRMGASFGDLPHTIDGKTIRELGISFGVSLPVRASSLDFAFRYGSLGTTSNNLIKETYFRVIIGATINDKWFIKRRHN